MNKFIFVVLAFILIASQAFKMRAPVKAAAYQENGGSNIPTEVPTARFQQDASDLADVKQAQVQTKEQAVQTAAAQHPTRFQQPTQEQVQTYGEAQATKTQAKYDAVQSAL